jgi:hypothetical protein
MINLLGLPTISKEQGFCKVISLVIGVIASNFSSGVDWDCIPNPANLLKKIDQNLPFLAQSAKNCWSRIAKSLWG